jgi:hypothetical protein
MQDAMCCGAKTTYKGWINFSCYNLGADDTLDPFTWNNTAGDANTINNGKPDVMDGQYKDIKGWMFEYGRQADGGQARNSAVVATGFPTIDQYNANPANYNNYFRNIDNTYYDWVTDPTSAAAQSRWGRDASADLNKPKHATDPCPPGWKIPVIWHFVYITSGSIDPLVQAHPASVANPVTWASGVKIGTSLFMSGNGWRDASNNAGAGGAMRQVGLTSNTWTTSSGGTNSSYSFVYDVSNFLFRSTDCHVSAATIRCVSE